MMLCVSVGTTTPNPTEKCRRHGPISIEGVIFRSNVMAAQGIGGSNIFYNLFQQQGLAWLCCRRGLVRDLTGCCRGRHAGARPVSQCTVRLWAKEHSELRGSTGGVDAEARDHFLAVIASEKILSKFQCLVRRSCYW